MTELEQIEQARPRRFRPYPEYKDSGVEWLGEIPAHWEMQRLKDLVLRLESGGTPESDNPRFWTDDYDGIPWVAISDMTRSYHVRETAKRLTEEGRRSKNLRVLPPGTLLYSMYASLGKVALLETGATINQAILGIVPRQDQLQRDYLRWWFEFMQAHVQTLSSSNTQDNLNADRVRKMPVVLPPNSDEQRAIAAFLDRETAKIDALVARKERLIELLQEKRTALITRAVTKGLDPTVPMKDSGVEWLGEIPAHWKVEPLFTLAKERDVRNVRGRETNVLSLSYGRIVRRNVSDNYGLLPASFDSYQIVEPGNVVLRLTDLQNDKRSLRVGYVPERGIITSAYVTLSIRAPLVPEYAAWLLHAYDVTKVFYSLGGGVRQTMKYDDLRWMPLLVPAGSEQRAIAAFLDRETAKIDALVTTVREAIERLKEYRTALISAAVTGKIDVRQEVSE